MTQEKNSTKEISANVRTNEVTSRVLKNLPESINLKQQSDCHMPQRGMVYGINGYTRPDPDGVLSDIPQRDPQSNYCKENIPVRMCDGIMIDNSQSQEQKS